MVHALKLTYFILLTPEVMHLTETHKANSLIGPPISVKHSANSNEPGPEPFFELSVTRTGACRDWQRNMSFVIYRHVSFAKLRQIGKKENMTTCTHVASDVHIKLLQTETHFM